MATTRNDTDQDDNSSETPIHDNNSAPTTEMAPASVASIPSDNSSVVVVGVQLTYTLPSRHVVDDDDEDTERTTSTTTTTTTTHTVRFDARQCQPARMGLPPPPPPPTTTHSSTITKCVTQSSLNHQPSLPLDQKPAPGDYHYAGVHDTGPLVPPKEDDDGDFDTPTDGHNNNNNNGARLTQFMTALQQARLYSDTYLTEIIQLEQQQQQPPPISATTTKATTNTTTTPINREVTEPIHKKAKQNERHSAPS